jgi:hypothetical protein
MNWAISAYTLVPFRDAASAIGYDLNALRSVCASAISGNSGVGEKPSSADASKA